MAKKIDFQALLQRGKDFALDKGEKVGLGLCGVIALLFLGLGVMKGLSPELPKSGKPWEKELEDRVKSLEAKLNQGLPEPPEFKPVTPDDLAHLVWNDYHSNYQPASLFSLGETVENKRESPVVLKPLEGKGYVQVDYLRCGVLAYAADQIKRDAWVFEGGAGAGGVGGGGDKGKGDFGASAVVKELLPRRMIVVNMVFPWRAQLENYRKALRYPSLVELLSSNDVPQPVGFNVLRTEVTPGMTKPNWQPLYAYDPDLKKLVVADHIQKFMNVALFDEDNVSQLSVYLKTGLATPLPLLGNFNNLYPNPNPYPKLQLTDIKLEEGEEIDPKVKPKGIDPMGKQTPMDMKKGKIDLGIFKKPPVGQENPQAEASTITLKKWKFLSKDVVDRLSGNFNIFDPLGQLREQVDDKKGSGAFVPAKGRPEGMDKKMAFPPMPMPKNDKGEVELPSLTDMLLRFIDVDVEPGKTYAYTVQVRMANPNFGRKGDVLTKSMAEKEELVSAFTSPEAIQYTVPGEYFLYAADQPPDRQIAQGSDTGAAMPPGKNEMFYLAPIQIHRWLTVANNQQIGDWAIAERLLIRRGDRLGREGVNVEVPVWKKEMGRFELGHAPAAKGKKVDPRKSDKGVVEVDFMQSPPPLLVDFEGGARKNIKVGTAIIPHDDAAYELLILGADGKLSLRSSRIDSDPGFVEGHERIERYGAWKKRIQELRTQASGTAKKDKAGP